MPAAPQQADPAQAPAAQPAANPAPANNAPPNQNMRMNAQGGLEEDDEAEQRDWLDYIYVFFRFLVLLSIVYFYSSASRFFTVAMGFLAIYLWVLALTCIKQFVNLCNSPWFCLWMLTFTCEIMGMYM